MEIIFYIVLIEIIFFLFSIYIRSINQWFITSKDKKPIFNREILDKVLLKSHDSLLGWDRKPNTSGIEKNEQNIVQWNINRYGARDNLEYNERESFISVFGDSFTFAREVNDNETWSYKLSCLTESNVANFGVGNYGFDQALLKLTNKLKLKDYRPEIVIIGIVPDTISRILSIWKHYYEYGNIFGIKPRYVLNDNRAELINNYIDSKEKFYHFYESIHLIQKNDYFYQNKFLKEVISFPYTIGFLKNFKRNLFMSYETLKKGSINKPTPYIMKKNLEYRIKLYKNKSNVNLLVKELELFEILSNKYNFRACLLIMPQKDDVNYIKENNHHFYKELTDNVPNGIDCVDIYDDFKKYTAEELDLLYCDDSEYGGHLSHKGNDAIAEIINKKIMRRENEKDL